jgi:hypothetical protein
MERAGGEQGHADGKGVLGRFGDAHRLGFIPGRFVESAELSEAHDQATPIPDRWRSTKSEGFVHPIGRQCGEVAGCQFDHPIILTPGLMDLYQGSW